jgi:nucleoside-diphosphate-sugar epimerase
MAFAVRWACLLSSDAYPLTKIFFKLNSTDAVFPSGLIDIDEDTQPQDTFEKIFDGYGQTKYVAEQLVLRFFSFFIFFFIYKKIFLIELIIVVFQLLYID